MAMWKSKGGRLLDMAAMSDEHLANAVAYMKRTLIDGLRTHDELEAEQRRRSSGRAEDSGWRLAFEADEFLVGSPGYGDTIRIWYATDPPGSISVVRTGIKGGVNGRLGEEFLVSWRRDRAKGEVRGDDWPTMVKAAMAVDKACFSPRTRP